MLRTRPFLPCLALVMVGCVGEPRTIQSAEEAIRAPSTFPLGWNRHKADVKSAEAANLFHPLEHPDEPISFGKREAEWNAFKSFLNSRRELWYWESPRYQTTANGMREYLVGYSIMDGSKVVAVFRANGVLERDTP